MDIDQSFHSVTIMMVASIIIGYYLSMTIIHRKNRTYNLQKMYLSLLMGLLMGLVTVLMQMSMNSGWMDFRYLMLTLVLMLLTVGVAYYYINQISVDQNDYLRGMIEHHQTAIEMSERNKSSLNPEVQQLINNIITTQKQEIDQMYRILKE